MLSGTDHSEEFANKDGDGEGQPIGAESASSCFSELRHTLKMPCRECSGQSSIWDRVLLGWKQPLVTVTSDHSRTKSARNFWGFCQLLLFCFCFVVLVWFLTNCDASFSLGLNVSVSCRVSSGAAAVVNHHGWDLSIDDLLLAVEVQHVDGRHLGGCAAGTRCAPRIGLVYQVCMRVLLQVQELTLPWAIVGPVALGRYDPVPSELLKVDREGVSTAARFCRFLITVEARVSARSLWAVEDFHFDERLLGDKEQQPKLAAGAWIQCMRHLSMASPSLLLQALTRWRPDLLPWSRRRWSRRHSWFPVDATKLGAKTWCPRSARNQPRQYLCRS